MKKGIVFYTDNAPSEEFLAPIRNHLKKICGGISIVWISQKPIPEKNNIVLSGIRRSYRSMCLQILTGLRNIEADVIFFAEHDIIYHPSHFDFEPLEKDIFYYNINRWWLREKDGFASYKPKAGSLSQLVAHKGICDDFYTKRMLLYEQGIKTQIKNEPAKRNVLEMPVYKIGFFYSKWPNIDIRHGHNYTTSDRFRIDDNDYILKDGIPGWGKTKGRYKEFIKELSDGNNISS